MKTEGAIVLADAGFIEAWRTWAGCGDAGPTIAIDPSRIDRGVHA